MVTSIFFTPTQIQILQGKLQKDLLHIYHIFTEPLAEGALINGVITDEAAIFRSMEPLLARTGLQKENFDLVIDAGAVLTKRLEVPILSEKKLGKISQDEFLEVAENHEDLLYDFGVLQRQKPDGQGGAILCAAMERRLAFSYIDLFKNLKLRLRSIDLAISCQAGLVKYLPELEDKTFIMVAFSGGILTCTLYEKGQYIFANRVRIQEEFNTVAFYDEVAHTLSSLVQFQRTQKSGEELTHVFLCGFPQGLDVVGLLKERIALEVSMVHDSPAVRLQAGAGIFHLAEYFYSTGNLLIKDGAYHG